MSASLKTGSREQHYVTDATFFPSRNTPCSGHGKILRPLNQTSFGIVDICQLELVLKSSYSRAHRGHTHLCPGYGLALPRVVAISIRASGSGSRKTGGGPSTCTQTRGVARIIVRIVRSNIR